MAACMVAGLPNTNRHAQPNAFGVRESSKKDIYVPSNNLTSYSITYIANKQIIKVLSLYYLYSNVFSNFITYLTCACSQNLRSVVPPYKKWFKPGLKLFGAITGCPNQKPNSLHVCRKFPNQNRTERFQFGSNQVCIGLKLNFPDTNLITVEHVLLDLLS